MKAPLAVIILASFLITSIIGPMPAYAQDQFLLPVPGVMVHLSPPLDPPILKGIKVHPDNPFRFDFILDKGDGYGPLPERSEGSQQEQLKTEATKLIKYFLASLTIPETDLWVNLSPYEKDRIIPQSFGRTEMGRDLLAEDYMLKQITASLIYPGDEVGKKFWKRIYEEAAKKFGTTNIPVNTFNKVWIVPDKAVVYENAKAGTAYVVESKLKVMLEQDYLALAKNQHQPTSNDLGSQIVREVVVPELTKEVNEDKNFSKLRQVYNSLILATWYKKKIKDSVLARVYSDKNKIAGVGYKNSINVKAIYQRYLQAFRKGVYNYIKEEQDPITQQIIPRKYFSGGFNLNMAMMTTTASQARVSSVLKSLGRKTIFLLGVTLALFNTINVSGQTVENFSNNEQTIEQRIPGPERPRLPVQGSEQTIRGFQIYGNQFSLNPEGTNPNSGTILSAQGQAEGTFNFFIYPNGESVMRISQDLSNIGLAGKTHFFLVNPARDKVSYMASTSTDMPSLSSGEIYLNQGLWQLVGQYLSTGSLSPADQINLQQQFIDLFGNASAPQGFLFTDSTGNVEFGTGSGQPNYSPFIFSKGIVKVFSPRFVPPDGKTVWLIGQQVDMINNYIAYSGKVPGGFMTYTSIDKLEGLSSPADEGGGVQNAQYLVDNYPNTVLQMGLYMVNQLDNITNHVWDANIETLANWIKQIGRPVYLRIGYEFDNPANGYDPVKYKAAYQYIVDKFRALGVTNVSYVWHSAAAPGQTLENALAWYPAPGYVDYVGMSRFNMSTQDVLGAQLAQFAREQNEAFMIAETSPMGLTSAQDRVDFFNSLFNFIQANNVKMVGNINCDWDTLPLFQYDGWGDQEIQNDGPVVVQLYAQRVLQNNSYLEASWNLFMVIKYVADRAMATEYARKAQSEKEFNAKLERSNPKLHNTASLPSEAMLVDTQGNLNASVLNRHVEELAKGITEINGIPVHIEAILGGSPVYLSDDRGKVPLDALKDIDIIYFYQTVSPQDEGKIRRADIEKILDRLLIDQFPEFNEKARDYLVARNDVHYVPLRVMYRDLILTGTHPDSKTLIKRYLAFEFFYGNQDDIKRTPQENDLYLSARERILHNEDPELIWKDLSRSERMGRVKKFIEDNVEQFDPSDFMRQKEFFDKYLPIHAAKHAYFASAVDRAMAKEKGGIDFTPARMDLQTQNAGEGIKFHLDPAMLKKLQNAPGFVPVIVNIQPMKNLEIFLGLAEEKSISNHS